MNAAFWLNTAWMKSCAGEARSFRRATHHVRQTQEHRLLHLLRENRDTWYGRRFEFAKIRTVQDYQQRVPLADYDQFRPPIDRIARGEPNVLTKQQVRLFEPTGGSTSGEKLIPYTDALRKEFQRASGGLDFRRHDQSAGGARGPSLLVDFAHGARVASNERWHPHRLRR